ncbi:hypothetical protein [Pseudomonas baltica]|uniref:hypothetical protein n=1 Tax=Pseudomonas baltica TaxID=2762576 RepID=UPI00289F687C|nr:hypothetical protein [Pseudomonas baltica]
MIIAPLALLADAGIIKGTHLLEMGQLTATAPFESQPQIMAILHTTNDALINVEQLLKWTLLTVDNKKTTL